MGNKKSKAEKAEDARWKSVRNQRRKKRKAEDGLRKKKKRFKKKNYKPATVKDFENFGNLLYHNRTKSELKLSEALVKEGIIFEEQYHIKCNKKTYYADFYFEDVFGQKYVVELDGYGHTTTAGREKDRARSDAMWKYHRIKTKRFWNPGSNKALEKVVDEICLLNPRVINSCEFREAT